MESKGTTLQTTEPPRSTSDAIKFVTPHDESDADAFAVELNALPTGEKIERLAEEAGHDYEEIAWLLCEASMQDFAEYHLAHHFTSADGQMHMNPRFHGDLIPLLADVELHQTKKPLVVAGFPECGKTTCISLLLPLHAICNGAFRYRPGGVELDMSKRFILFMSAIEKNARGLMDPVLHELEENTTIAEMYGHLFKPPDGGKRSRQVQVSAQAATTFNGIHLEARSRSTKLRTIKWRQYRPDLAILDDIEDDKSVTSRVLRQQLMTWFTTVFLNRLSSERGNAIVTGNILHEHSLMNNLLVYGDAHKWLTRIYKVSETDPDTGVKTYLMPERFGEEWEKAKREELLGRESAYDQEFLQNPTAGEAEISYEDITYYTPQELEGRMEFCDVYLAMDPAASQDQKADFTSISAIAYDNETGVCFVRPFTHDHLDIGAQVDAAVRMYIRHDPIRFGVEAVGYQKVLAPLIEKEAMSHGFSIPICEVKQGRTDKHTRIRRLFPSIKNGTLRFLRDEDTHIICIDQLVTISKGVEPENDDAADSLEMAKRLQEEDAISEYGDNMAEVHIL